MHRRKQPKKKYTILFIATFLNYFLENNASFRRMYNNLIYFYNHEDFNVIVLQPNRDKEREKKSLKKDIKTYYFKEIHIFKKNLVPLIDFNPLYIFNVLKIIKKHKIDLIHIDYLYGINCLRLIRKIPVSYNSYNVESIYADQVGKYWKTIPMSFRSLYTKYIFILEKFVLKFVNNINAVSLADKKKYIEIYKTPNDKIFINPFGFREELIKKPLSKIEARKHLNLNNNTFIVIFHCNYFLNYGNREATHIIKDIIAPRINNENILFLIAGKMPSFKNTVNLKFLGYVDDLRDFLFSADIAIAPILRGSCVKTKIIDYLSANLPIITTKVGAEGLPLENGFNSYITDDPIQGIINKIIALYNDHNKIKEIKKNIYKLIIKHYKWDSILDKLAERYKQIITSPKQ